MPTPTPSYIVATTRLQSIEPTLDRLPDKPWIVTNPKDLAEVITNVQPRYIFFPHWHEKVPPLITEEWECIGFHMTKLPDGRGGSPLQNLIARGSKETILTAFRMTSEMDAGDIYAEQLLRLEGTASEILTRAGCLITHMIRQILEYKPIPWRQRKPTKADAVFRRRKPDESVLPQEGNLEQIYDHIRMLDADIYPPAFLQWGKWRLEFVDAHYSSKTNDIIAHVTIREAE